MRKLFLILVLCALAPSSVWGRQGEPYALLIGGLGGDPAYTEKFKTYLFDTRRALTQSLGLPEDHVHVLGEPAIEGESFVDATSTADNIRARFATLAAQVTPDDDVLVVLFGHGSTDGTQAALNIPRRDLMAEDYATLVDGLNARRVVFVNTASASAPFIEAISGPERIVITATRRGSQRNETLFPVYFIEALSSPGADMDKSGDLSVREVFDFAALRTAQAYEVDGNLATEHALLDDTGDGVGHRAEDLAAEAEGNLAAVTYLRRQARVAAAAGPEAAQQLRAKDQLELDIADLQSRKAQMPVDAYYAELEVLFVQLARLNDTLEAR